MRAVPRRTEAHMPKPGRGVGSGEAYLTVTVLIWGTSFPIAKPVLAVMDPWVFGFVRCGLASLLLLGVLRMQGRSLALPRHEVLPMVGLGLLGVTCFQGLWGVGLAHTTASKAAILIATSPVWGTLIAHFGGERLSSSGWLGVFLSFAGVLLIVNNSLVSLTVIGGGADLGDLIFLGNAIAFAVYSAVSRPFVARHGALKTMVWVLLFGTCGLLLLGVPGFAAQDWAQLQGPLLLNLLYVGFGASAIAQVTWYAALSRLGLVRTVVAMFLVPVIAVLTAFAFLGETVSPLQGCGAALVLGGIWLCRRRPAK
ncbi:MAG: EamA family transporter [Rhodospirillales bacterium]|nr:EamA family transporter [Rhodospirillales bacterium]